jgi:2-polyprenyl-3-methyl-5-hydroxy-6-metoxy-1,4-benzoquinol methylase
MSMLAARIKHRVGRAMRDVGTELVQSAALPEPTPHFSEYTTTDGPMEVPVQREAYWIAVTDYLRDGDSALDVGCGLGYGLDLLSIKAAEVSGIDVDEKAIAWCRSRDLGRNPRIADLRAYDGERLPYDDDSFDVVTSIDVIEHVPDYDRFVDELLRVARRAVVISTPNRRPEFTKPDGTPMNHWHLREWTRDELAAILAEHAARVEWHHVNGPWDGPCTVSSDVQDDTQTLTPALLVT